MVSFFIYFFFPHPRHSFVVALVSQTFLVLPLFNPTKIFLQNLERFHASLYMATSERMEGFSSQKLGHGADLGVCGDSTTINLKIGSRCGLASLSV